MGVHWYRQEIEKRKFSDVKKNEASAVVVSA